jgi:HSP20 family protein
MEVLTMSMMPSGRSGMSRWDPWQEFRELQSRLDQLMGGVFGSGGGEAGVLSGWTPLADVTETSDAYVIKVEVPGVKREDIHIEVTGTELAIRGETKADDEGGQPRQRARRYGRFEYRAALPTQIDTSAITAEMSDGVLTVRVPKSQADQPRRIEITGR